VSGTVTDASGSPLEGVTVASEAGPITETDTQGRYELTVPPGTQPIGATGPGFDTIVTRLDPANTDTRAFQLDRTDSLDVEMADRMSRRIDPGETAVATFDVANVGTVVVEAETEGLFGPGELELSVDGTPAAFGEPVSVDSGRTQLTVGVSVPEPTPIGQFRLAYEFTGGGESVTGEGHLVHAHADPFVVSPAEPPTLQAPIDLVAPRTTIELTDGQGDAVASTGDNAGIVIDKPLTLTAADGATPTVQFSNDGAEEPVVALVTANDVTISGLVVDGTGAETGIQVARDRAVARPAPQPSGVTVRDLVISGADTAVHTVQSPALQITDNELTAKTTAISVGERIPFRDSTTVTGRPKTTVRRNSITDVETGIDVAGQVAAVEDNTLSNIGTTGIRLGTPRFLSRHWGQDIGPVRSNTITGVNRGIVVSGVMTLPVEQNTLSDIAETALVVDGAVLAPIRANSIDGARTGLTIADDAEVTTLTDNEFINIQEPGDEKGPDDAGETGASDQDGTDDGTTAQEDTESTADPEDDTETGADETAESGSDDSGPGFGIPSTLVSLGGAGYLLKRRFSDDETESG
jgi:PGF-CTERM protein